MMMMMMMMMMIGGFFLLVGLTFACCLLLLLVPRADSILELLCSTCHLLANPAVDVVCSKSYSPIVGLECPEKGKIMDVAIRSGDLAGQLNVPFSISCSCMEQCLGCMWVLALSCWMDCVMFLLFPAHVSLMAGITFSINPRPPL